MDYFKLMDGKEELHGWKGGTSYSLVLAADLYSVYLEEQIVHMRQGMYQNEEHASSSTKQKEPLGNAEQLKEKRVLRRYPSSGDLSDHVTKQGKQHSFCRKSASFHERDFTG